MIILAKGSNLLARSPWVGYTSAQFETIGVTECLRRNDLSAADAEFLATIQQFGRFL